MGLNRVDYKSRFNNKWALSSGGCWIWLGGVGGAGYGQWHVIGERWAHRVAWRLFRGEIPQGLEVDHLCRVRCCVNPGHLELVTHQVNQQRMGAIKTHCPKGHPYSPENLLSKPHRDCRVCHREREQRRRDVARQARAVAAAG